MAVCPKEHEFLGLSVVGRKRLKRVYGLYGLAVTLVLGKGPRPGDTCLEAKLLCRPLRGGTGEKASLSGGVFLLFVEDVACLEVNLVCKASVTEGSENLVQKPYRIVVIALCHLYLGCHDPRVRVYLLAWPYTFYQFGGTRVTSLLIEREGLQVLGGCASDLAC